MTARKSKPSKQAGAPSPLAEKPAPKPTPKPSQADAAHIATAGYWREQREAIDRIAKLKAKRLAQGEQPKPTKPKPKKKAPDILDRPRATRRHRWGT